MTHLAVMLLYIIPKNLLSRVIATIVQLKLPKGIQDKLNEGFVNFFKINMSEAEHPLNHYESIEDVFIRKLRPGSREVVGDFCSPCDGTLSQGGILQSNSAIQAKGLHYDANELAFGDNESQKDFEQFTTIYLAPHNYHRVHSPVKGKLKCIRYIPGELWPVNQISITNIPRVFTRNERLCFEIEGANGGVCHLVMVGALNVGRITSPFWPEFHSNAHFFEKGKPATFSTDMPKDIDIADELGTFMLGSTVVLIMDREFVKSYHPAAVEEPKLIQLGDSLEN